MDMTRRRFIILAAAAAATGVQAWAAGRRVSASRPTSSPHVEPAEDVFDAGPVSAYQGQGVYDRFREDGFFIIHRDGQLFALSSTCTHKGCTIRAQRDQTFRCRCHGSQFDAEGHVTKGPAQRDLPRLKVAKDQKEHLLVHKLS
jgi:Rieske Fe-S protein